MIYLKYKSSDMIVTQIKVTVSANQVLLIPLRKPVMAYKISLHDLERWKCSNICKSFIPIPFLEQTVENFKVFYMTTLRRALNVY
jgi:hypothetical protein